MKKSIALLLKWKELCKMNDGMIFIITVFYRNSL